MNDIGVVSATSVVKVTINMHVGSFTSIASQALRALRPQSPMRDVVSVLGASSFMHVARDMNVMLVTWR